MTKTQIKAINFLLDGCYLVSALGHYRIRDKRHNPKMKIHGLTFTSIFPLLKRKTESPAVWIISIASILKQRKNTTIKKLYLKRRKEKKMIALADLRSTDNT